MAILRVLAALLVIGSGTRLPPAAAETDILQLGGLFENDDSLAVLGMLQIRQCVPKDFSISKELVTMVTCGLKRGCPGAPKDAVIYDCVAKRTGMISGNKINKQAYTAFIGQFTSDPVWLSERRPLDDACLSTIDTELTGGQQAVHIFSCWQWSLLLDCDLHETGGQLSAEASCRRAAFLAGDCPMSPPALLEVLPGVAAEHSWKECAVDMPDRRTTDCRKRDAAAVRLVSCRLQQYVADGAGGEVDLERLRQDVDGSAGDEQAKRAMLAIVDGCGGETGRPSVQQLVLCWAARGIMSCAASEAAERASQYQPC